MLIVFGLTLILLVFILLFCVQNKVITPSADYTYSGDKIGVFGLTDDTSASELGVGWTRAPVTWIAYEKQKEKFDQAVQDLTNTKILATLRSVNSQKTTCYRELTGLGANDISCYPKNMDEYEEFIRSVVTSYKNDVDAWQIENEIYLSYGKYWNGDNEGEIDNFITLFNTAKSVIDEVDPGKAILAPGIALHNVDFDSNGNALLGGASEIDKQTFPIIEKNVARFYKEACGSFSIADIHLYHSVDSITNRIKWLGKIMDSSNCQKPIWATEVSGPDIEASDTDLAPEQKENIANEQAKELPLRIKKAFDAGVEKVFYFHFKDTPNSRGTQDQKLKNLGLVKDDGTKKPAFSEMQKLTGKIKEETKEPKKPDNPDKPSVPTTPAVPSSPQAPDTSGQNNSTSTPNSTSEENQNNNNNNTAVSGSSSPTGEQSQSSDSNELVLDTKKQTNIVQKPTQSNTSIKPSQDQTNTKRSLNRIPEQKNQNTQADTPADSIEKISMRKIFIDSLYKYYFFPPPMLYMYYLYEVIRSI